MVSFDDTKTELANLIDTHSEWLLIHENGKTFPIQNKEIEITVERNKVVFSFLDDKGFRASRVVNCLTKDEKISLSLASNFGRKREKLTLVPRASAIELSLNIELARLETANKIAKIIVENNPGSKLIRVALNKENGRLAQIIFATSTKKHLASLADVSGVATPETLLTTAILWLRKLERRTKNPIDEVWIVAEKKRARNLQKIRALLRESWKIQIRIVEISGKPAETKLKHFANLKITDLWRERVTKLTLPESPQISETAQKIISLWPEKIDVIFSKKGETLRFMGLPFVRVRKILGTEKAWFGIERDKQILSDKTWNDLTELIENLENYRRFDTPNKRHELYRLTPEAWLEAILRRNIKLLDANLILSPIYNQFRASADKIDLLALRRDGRLVIIELKTSPNREMIFQAVDYWRKIELQRRRGHLQKARLFGDLEILDKPALIYMVAPALSFHLDFEFFSKMISKEIELWRFELHENWREDLKVLARKNYSGSF